MDPPGFSSSDSRAGHRKLKSGSALCTGVWEQAHLLIWKTYSALAILGFGLGEKRKLTGIMSQLLFECNMVTFRTILKKKSQLSIKYPQPLLKLRRLPPHYPLITSLHICFTIRSLLWKMKSLWQNVWVQNPRIQSPNTKDSIKLNFIGCLHRLVWEIQCNRENKN